MARRFLVQTIHDVALMLDREMAGREASPTAAVIDSQTIKAPQGKTRGYNGGTRIVGRKRHIAVDTDGRLLQPDFGLHLRQRRCPGDPGRHPQALALGEAPVADAAYDRLKLRHKAAYLDFVVEIIRRSDQQTGFEVLPRR